MLCFDQQMKVPMLHRVVKHPHREPPLRPLNRAFDDPVEPLAPKPKAWVDSKRDVDGNVVGKRRPSAVTDSTAALGPPRTRANAPMTLLVEMKLEVLLTTASLAGLRRRTPFQNTARHPFEYGRYLSKSRRFHPFQSIK